MPLFRSWPKLLKKHNTSWTPTVQNWIEMYRIAFQGLFMLGSRFLPKIGLKILRFLTQPFLIQIFLLMTRGVLSLSLYAFPWSEGFHLLEVWQHFPSTLDVGSWILRRAFDCSTVACHVCGRWGAPWARSYTLSLSCPQNRYPGSMLTQPWLICRALLECNVLHDERHVVILTALALYNNQVFNRVRWTSHISFLYGCCWEACEL